MGTGNRYIEKLALRSRKIFRFSRRIRKSREFDSF